MAGADDTYPSYDEVDIEVASVKELLDDGLFRFGAGDSAGAVAAWQRVLELEPGNDVARDYLRSAGVTPLPKPAPSLRVAPPAAMAPPPAAAPPPFEGEPRHSIRRSQQMPVVGGEITPRQRPPSVIVEQSIKRDRRALFGLIGILLIAFGGALTYLLVRDNGSEKADKEAPEIATGQEAAASTASSPASERTYELSIRAQPADAEILLDGKVVARGALDIELPKDGKKRQLVVRAAGFVEKQFAFVDVAPDEKVVLTRAATRPTRVTRNRKRRGQRGGTAPKPREVAPEKPAPAQEPPPARVAKEPPVEASKPPVVKSDNKNPWKE